ncbi:hypothetical protein, partial [Cupriavidus sp. AU9028]|uniref:hypothetical protein n=1 Tax=Cupriavidus sp. AU9028 TaxID=2871157 RepID=UPI001C983C18
VRSAIKRPHLSVVRVVKEPVASSRAARRAACRLALLRQQQRNEIMQTFSLLVNRFAQLFSEHRSLRGRCWSFFCTPAGATLPPPFR